MIAFVERHGVETFAEAIVRNRQRTSSTNGILKADAALRLALVLNRHGIHRMEHMHDISNLSAVEEDAWKIPGQRSGTSLKYLYMLAGADDLVKPDRMILRYLNDVLDRSVTTEEAQNVISHACGLLAETGYPGVSPRLLDNLIWNYQRR